MNDTTTPSRKRRYDYQGSVHPCGSEITTKVPDGWQFAGACIKPTEDGEGSYIQAYWRREIKP